MKRFVVPPVNYQCPTCMSLNRLPNIAGRFHLINETQCQCNGCNTIYPKEMFYTVDTKLEERPVLGSKTLRSYL